jgi:hypothetical protein
MLYWRIARARACASLGGFGIAHFENDAPMAGRTRVDVSFHLCFLLAGFGTTIRTGGSFSLQESS